MLIAEFNCLGIVRKLSEYRLWFLGITLCFGASPLFREEVSQFGFILRQAGTNASSVHYETF